MSNIDGDDLVFYSDSDNQIYSGGFNVNSIMMKAGISPFKTLNKINSQTGGTGNVADVFKDLIIPTWLLSQDNIFRGGSKNTKNDDDSEDDEVISDELHDKLLELVTVSDSELKNRKKHTKRFKNKVTKNKVTKRNK
jgi:hypothetical protein